MNATTMTTSAPDLPWELPTRGRVGILTMIAAEVAIFVDFVVAYLFYIGKSLTGPMPKTFFERRSLLRSACFQQFDDSLRRQSDWQRQD
jgi:hypothetical protein